VSTAYGILAVLAAFLLLIGSHEAGHFSVAKLFRVRVHEFSIGFGTKIASFVRGGTLYAFRIFPLGGYVRLGGMEPGEYELPDGFHSKPAYQRLLVLLAGPLANFVTASVLVALLLLPSSAAVAGTVLQVEPQSPAAAAGIRPGSVIVSADGQQLNGDIGKLRSIEAQTKGAPLSLVVRDSAGGERTLTVTPHYDKTQGAYIIGVVPAQLTPLEAIGTAAAFPWLTIRDIGTGLWQLVTGQVPGGLGGPNGVTGPIGISYATYSAAEQGVQEYLQVLALLSVALGLTNLLPLPALDGARIAVVLIEAARRRPLNRDREMAVQRYGLVALMALIAVIGYLDVSRIVNHQFPGAH
jgi:regulator of sigma E protease